MLSLSLLAIRDEVLRCTPVWHDKDGQPVHALEIETPEARHVVLTRNGNELISVDHHRAVRDVGAVDKWRSISEFTAAAWGMAPVRELGFTEGEVLLPGSKAMHHRQHEVLAL